MGLKAGGPLFAVRDMKMSLAFYQAVLGLEVINDFGANAVLTGGLSLQTLDTWASFLDKSTGNIHFGGNDAEMYYEADDFDTFLTDLKDHPEAELVHPPLEHRWGQRVVRLYDPDHHIIEVGENIKTVCRRFLDSGMTVEETAQRMDVPEKFIRACMR